MDFELLISNVSGWVPTVAQMVKKSQTSGNKPVLGWNQKDGLLYGLRIYGSFKSVVCINGLMAPAPVPDGMFQGTATLATNPGTPVADEWWTATETGVYANFGGVEVTTLTDVLNYLKWTEETGSWSIVKVEIPSASTLAQPLNLCIFKQGANGIVFPQRFKWSVSKKVSSVQLMSNCASISVTVGSTNYDQTSLIGLTLVSGTELIINDIIVKAGFDNANAIIVF